MRWILFWPIALAFTGLWCSVFTLAYLWYFDLQRAWDFARPLDRLFGRFVKDTFPNSKFIKTWNG